VIIAETIIVLGTACWSLPSKRRRSETQMNYITCGSSEQNCFQISDSATMEESLQSELEEIVGVHSVQVERNGNDFMVEVTLHSLAFEIFERVIEKEIALFDEFPNLNFRFNIQPASVTEEHSPTFHAA
jgi:hypothetical protein